jgi:hypothetical protein
MNKPNPVLPDRLFEKASSSGLVTLSGAAPPVFLDTDLG